MHNYTDVPGPPPGYTAAGAQLAPLEGLVHDPGAPTLVGHYDPVMLAPTDPPGLPWWAAILMMFVGALAAASGLGVVVASLGVLVYLAPWLS